MSKINLTTDQEAAVTEILQFLADPTKRFYALKGWAGTGKSFCLREVLARASRSGAKFAFTAPTNKAAKVLRSFVPNAGTIYSLLGLRIDTSGEVKELVAGKAPTDLSDLTCIFIDEASMISTKLLQVIMERAIACSVKVIFIGDPAQLPPVGEAISPVWEKVTEYSELTTVMRYSNAILGLATMVREAGEHAAPCITIKSDNKDGEGVWKLGKAAFKEAIYAAAKAGAFDDGAKAKVIAWRNARVEEYNHLIRHAIFGAVAEHTRYFAGERIVAAAPCKRGEDLILSTDEEAIVETVTVCQHPIEPKYKAYELLVVAEDGRKGRILAIHPDSQLIYANDCEKLAAEARIHKHLWKSFWTRKELFHDIKHAYALTAHRSQGSTYEVVYADYQDILINRNRKEAFQCLYVATSRAAKQLHLA